MVHSRGSKIHVLAFKIRVLRQKLVIICTTRAGENLGVLADKISVLRKKIVICPTSAVAYLSDLPFKIYI